MKPIDTLDLLGAILRGDPVRWSELGAETIQQVYPMARRHGVHLLVADRLWQRDAMRECPPELKACLTASLRSQLAADEIARRELRTVLAVLAENRICPLLLKGAGLAFTHYRDPVLRPRADTDLLVERRSRDAAVEVLEQLGYTRVPLLLADLAMRQTAYARADAHGVRHLIDLHWHVTNAEVFARALTPHELFACAVTVPALGEVARAPSPIHALAIACAHRVAHHRHEERLIWLYDIHLVADSLSDAMRDDFVAFAAAGQIAAVCADGLDAAHRAFHGTATKDLLARLDSRPAAGREPSERFAGASLRRIDVLMSDLRALPGLEKARLVREHLFPPAAYMRAVYGGAAWLPALYAWRILRGASGWFRSGDSVT